MVEITGRSLGLTAVKGRPLYAKDIAQFFGMTTRWAQKHFANGTFPVRTREVFGRYLVDSVDFDNFLNKVSKEAGDLALPKKAMKKIKKRSKTTA